MYSSIEFPNNKTTDHAIISNVYRSDLELSKYQTTFSSDLRSVVVSKRAAQRDRLMSPVGHRLQLRVVGFWILCIVFFIVLVASLAFGSRSIPVETVFYSLWQFDGSITEHLVIFDLRLPRTFIGIAVGAALGVAGVLMQAITRNPLADPGLLGVNAGASFAVVLAIWLLGLTTIGGLVWFAFLGAGSISVLVYMLGSLGRGAATPVRLALAGAAMSALLFALISAIILNSQETLQVYRFWVVGSLTGAVSGSLVQLLPFMAIGLLTALMAATSLNAMALGDEMAQVLGTKIALTRVLTLASVTLLSGASVAMAGPVAFIGLVVPHMARFWCGPNQYWLILYALLLGPIVLIVSDTIGRIILPPGEVQVGIMTALIGGSTFVWIVRRMRMAQL